MKREEPWTSDPERLPLSIVLSSEPFFIGYRYTVEAILFWSDSRREIKS